MRTDVSTYLDRYDDEGLEGLIDRRLEPGSHRRAPGDEVMALTARYRHRHSGWNVKHFYAWYRRAGGGRRSSWVKNTLQGAGLVTKAVKRGAAHSPELNPDEQVWNELKHRQLGKQPIKNKIDLKKRIRSILKSLQRKAEQVRSFFQPPDTKYAAITDAAT